MRRTLESAAINTPENLSISYSSIKDSHECPFRFKLKKIDKIVLRDSSIDLAYGTLMHKCVQDLLLKKRTTKETETYFWRVWKKFYKLYKKNLDGDKVRKFLIAGLNVIANVEKSFKGYKVIAVEEEINTLIENKDIKFKGYIDLVMKKGKKIIIADLKTASNTYMFKTYLDNMKRAQLLYYKKYYAEKHKVKESNIETCYIVLEKAPRSKDPIQFINEKCGTKEIIESQMLMNETINMVETNSFPKNKNVCYSEKTGIKCPFYLTKYCT